MTWLRAVLFNLAFYFWTVVFVIACVPLLAMPPAVLHRAAGFWARGVMALLAVIAGLRYRIEGLEHLPDGPAIWASKHQSAWDTIVFFLIPRKRIFVLKRELLFIPFYGWGAWHMGCIPVDRKAGARALKALVKRARTAITAGYSLVIFPEGTRVPPGAAKTRLQPGVVALYRALDLPVVPVALNSGVFWGRRTFLKKRGCITLRFLPPLAPGLDRPAFEAQLASSLEQETRRLEDRADPS